MLKTIYNITTSSTPDERKPATGFAVIPYIQGVTEPIKRILNSHNVKKLFRLWGIFLPNLRILSQKQQQQQQRTDAIDSIPCSECGNEYIGQTKHQFGTRLKEHQKAVF